DHAEAAFADAPADASDRFGVGAVPMQHLRRQCPPEWCLAEPVVRLQLLDHDDTSPFVSVDSVPGSGSWPRTCPSGTGSSRSWAYWTRSASSALCWASTRRR